MSSWKSVLLAGGSAILCGVAYGMLKKTDILKKLEKQCEVINEVLFYGDNERGSSKKAGLDNLYCIYYVIVHANRSIDVCMPSLMSETITKCLVDVKQKSDVKIRVVIHKSDSSEQVGTLIENGIEVKVVESIEKLEHEFILVDAAEQLCDAVALIGSLDYEVHRVNRNKDNTLLTSEAVVVTALKSEFDRIWDSVVQKLQKDPQIQK